jgi:hypothetical protein
MMEAEPWRRRQRPAWRRILDRRRHQLYSLLWKIRFAVRFCRLTHMPLSYGWQCAESNLENLDGDTSVPPSEMVDDEIEEGLRD